MTAVSRAGMPAPPATGVSVASRTVKVNSDPARNPQMRAVPSAANVPASLSPSMVTRHPLVAMPWMRTATHVAASARKEQHLGRFAGFDNPRIDAHVGGSKWCEASPSVVGLGMWVLVGRGVAWLVARMVAVATVSVASSGSRVGVGVSIINDTSNSVVH